MEDDIIIVDESFGEEFIENLLYKSNNVYKNNLNRTRYLYNNTKLLSKVINIFISGSKKLKHNKSYYFEYYTIDTNTQETSVIRTNSARLYKINNEYMLHFHGKTKNNLWLDCDVILIEGKFKCYLPKHNYIIVGKIMSCDVEELNLKQLKRLIRNYWWIKYFINKEE